MKLAVSIFSGEDHAKKRRACLQTLGIKMVFVAYNYFPTPSESDLGRISDAVYESDLKLSHLGKNDPPKKWTGLKEEFHEVLKKGDALTNYTHSRAKENGIEIDFIIHNDPRWDFSEISLSGKNREYIESTCLHFSTYLNSYMCISGQLGLGPAQDWKILLESELCPESLKEKVNNA